MLAKLPRMIAIPPPARRPITIEQWDAARFEADVDLLMDIYVEAMGYQPAAGRQRGRAARGQTTFPGFRARVARCEDGTVSGFCYGYTSEPGQWWHQLVERAVPAQHSAWLHDAFELSELHVRPDQQARGDGHALLLALAEGLPHQRMLLSTPDADTRAMRLYHRMGFQDLARRHYFPGELRPFAVLGRRLPF